MAIHVLHLEDDGPLCDILGSVFRAADPSIQLQQFINSDTAVEYIEKNIQNIDLFVLDIRVPGAMDGLQVAQRIRDLGYSTSIALTSAYSKPNPDVLEKLRCEWFPKPWHIIEIAPKLFQMARQRKLEQS